MTVMNKTIMSCERSPEGEGKHGHPVGSGRIGRHVKSCVLTVLAGYSHGFCCCLGLGVGRGGGGGLA